MTEWGATIAEHGRCESCRCADSIKQFSIVYGGAPTLRLSDDQYKIPQVRIIEVVLCSKCSRFIRDLLRRIA